MEKEILENSCREMSKKPIFFMKIVREIRENNRTYRDWETRVEGLQITEDDILFNGISSDNWSDAQGLSISRKLCISQKPKLSAVFLDRAESMSKKTLQEFVEWAKSEGIQTIITKIVDEKPQTKEDNVYFIYDGTLVDVEEEE